MAISLSPMDYYFFRKSLYTIQFVFEYSATINETRFQQGLSNAVRACEVFGSRIKIISNNKLVLLTGHPVPFRTQFFEDEIRDTDNVEALLDPVANVEGEPLIRVLATKTKHKSYIGISFSHLLGDGHSFFQFVQILSSFICGNLDYRAPCNQRSLLTAKPFDQDSTALFPSTGYVTPRPPNAEAYEVLNFYCSFDQLKEAREKFLGAGHFISNNDLLMAALAKNFHSDIPLHEGKFLIRCPVDYRKIYNLPEEYFGNAVRDAIAVFHPDELANLNLGEVALRIRHAIHGVDLISIKRSLAALDRLRIENGIQIFEDVGCPGLLVSNLSKFPIHLADFGSGAPVRFHHASLNPRLALILPAENGLKISFKRPVSKRTAKTATPQVSLLI